VSHGVVDAWMEVRRKIEDVGWMLDDETNEFERAESLNYVFFLRLSAVFAPLR
jgi:hypothetical protein